jgi:hypothetical protein
VLCCLIFHLGDTPLLFLKLTFLMLLKLLVLLLYFLPLLHHTLHVGVKIVLCLLGLLFSILNIWLSLG